MRRREVLKASLLLLGSAASASVSRALLAQESLTSANAAGVFGESHGSAIELLSDMIVPATDTPGAVEAGVPDFIATIFRDWYNDAERDSFLEGLAALDDACRQQEGRAFDEASGAARLAALEDQQAMASAAPPPPGGPFGISGSDGADAPFFRKIKELVVLGYYTSEIGATQELMFLAAPGRFDGDVAVSETMKILTH